MHSPAVSKDSPKPFIRTMFLADRAELINGKLYVMGGYVERVWTQRFPTMANLTLVMVLGIPSILANQPVPFTVDISSPLTNRILKMNGSTQVGGDPRIVDSSQPLRSIVTMPITMPVRSPGTVSLVATLEWRRDGDDRTEGCQNSSMTRSGGWPDSCNAGTPPSREDGGTRHQCG